MDYKYNGIILGKKDVGETDRIYIIYTLEEGKIRALGKGVRRPNAKLAGHLEPLTYAEIFLAKSRGLGKITSSVVVENFSKIKSDIEALTQISYAVRILEKLIPEQQKDEAIFNLFADYLTVMEKLSAKEGPEKKTIVTLGFLFKLLSESGYKLEAKQCVICGHRLRPESNYFSASRGGIICDNCQASEREKVRAEDSSIKFMRLFSQNKIGNLAKLHASKEEVDNLKKIVRAALDWIVR